MKVIDERYFNQVKMKRKGNEWLE